MDPFLRGYDKLTDAEAIELWSTLCAKVRVAEKAMVEGHYYQPLTEAYNAAVKDKRALAWRLDQVENLK